MTAAVAFLAGARAIVDQAAPGSIQWGEAGRERDVPFVAVRARFGDRRGDARTSRSTTRSARARSCCRSANRRCATASTTVSTGGSPARARRRARRARSGSSTSTCASAGRCGGGWRSWPPAASRRPSARWSTAAAEAVLRGAPGASPSVVRMLARDTLGAIPVTPEGYAYVLADDGLHDPLRGVRRGGDKPEAGRPARQRGVAVRPPRAPHRARAQRGGVRRRARNRGDGGAGGNRPAACTSSCGSIRPAPRRSRPAQVRRWARQREGALPPPDAPAEPVDPAEMPIPMPEQLLTSMTAPSQPEKSMLPFVQITRRRREAREVRLELRLAAREARHRLRAGCGAVGSAAAAGADGLEAHAVVGAQLLDARADSGRRGRFEPPGGSYPVFGGFRRRRRRTAGRAGRPGAQAARAHESDRTATVDRRSRRHGWPRNSTARRRCRRRCPRGCSGQSS